MRRAVILLALVACTDPQLGRMQHAKDAVCACKTSACAETAMKDVPQEHVKSTHRTQLLAQQMLDCISKLYDKERPKTDPDSAASARTP